MVIRRTIFWTQKLTGSCTSLIMFSSSLGSCFLKGCTSRLGYTLLLRLAEVEEVSGFFGFYGQ